MILKEKEKAVIEDLHTQEQTCVEKYTRYEKQAKDPVLKDLFKRIKEEEQEHVNSLEKVLQGNVPQVDCNDNSGEKYEPKATYDAATENEDKKSDCFLATDCIGTEKLVSTEYNTNVFAFADAAVRKLLADIQIEEQNHAQMLYKYKTVNGMA